MKGYVRRKGDRWYAVIYEGVDPATGKERRSWHAAGTERADAERLAAKLAAQANRRQDKARAMTFGAYLQSQWLPAKKAALRPSTYAGYRRNVELHVTPTLGRIPIRRLRDKHLEELYERLAHPAGDALALSPKTVLEIHLIVRAALADALRDEYVTRNVALSAAGAAAARHPHARAAVVDRRAAPGVPAGGGRASTLPGVLDAGDDRDAAQ